MGQVGSEVSLYLSQMDDVIVVPICRTEYASAFLRQCGLSCRHGNLSQPEEAARLLADCDLVADFSLPKGLPSEIRSSIKNIITNSIKAATSNTRFVYISSTMALGMGLQSNKKMYRHYMISRSVYSAMKRYGERLAMRLGRTMGREVYALRLGQVHGELQSVSRSLIRQVGNEMTYVPGGLSDTVFAFTIAEALKNIALAKEKPGLYTLVSSPQWKWREVHEFYARRAGIEPQVLEFETKKNVVFNFYRIMRSIFSGCVSFISNKRELFMAHILYLFPKIERRAKAFSLLRLASQEISQGTNQNIKSIYDPIAGELPGRRLHFLSDSRKTMSLLACKIHQIIEGVKK